MSKKEYVLDEENFGLANDLLGRIRELSEEGKQSARGETVEQFAAFTIGNKAEQIQTVLAAAAVRESGE